MVRVCISVALEGECDVELGLIASVGRYWGVLIQELKEPPAVTQDISPAAPASKLAEISVSGGSAELRGKCVIMGEICV